MYRRHTVTALNMEEYANLQKQYADANNQNITSNLAKMGGGKTPGMTHYPTTAAQQPAWFNYMPIYNHPNPRQQPPQQPPQQHYIPNEQHQHANQLMRPHVKPWEKEQHYGDFTIKKTLGKGAFSKVLLAEHHQTKLMFALKFINTRYVQSGSPEKHLARIKREVMLLSLLHHPNIVKIYDVEKTSKYIVLVMEHNSGGELLHYILKRGRLHESEARHYFRQIISAMDYLHRNCIIHRDLKMENIMLDHRNRIRIIDFGFANVFNWDRLMETFCGSPLYISPEMACGIRYTGPEVDIWSMGVLLYFMVCGCMPFEGKEKNEVSYKISKGKFTLPKNLNLSKDIQNLIQHMLTVNPKLRITMKGIIEHPWTNKGYNHLVDNYLPARPSVVPHPNLDILQKMKEYNYMPEVVASSLMHSEASFTPMVCIYHLIEEAHQRKALRSAQQSYAGSLAENSTNISTADLVNDATQAVSTNTGIVVKAKAIAKPNELPLDSVYLALRKGHGHTSANEPQEIVSPQPRIKQLKHSMNDESANRFEQFLFSANHSEHNSADGEIHHNDQYYNHEQLISGLNAQKVSLDKPSSPYDGIVMPSLQKSIFNKLRESISFLKPKKQSNKDRSKAPDEQKSGAKDKKGKRLSLPTT